MEWNKIDVNIQKAVSCNAFKRLILKFIIAELYQVFNVHSSEGLKFLTRIRFGLSHLANHKFRDNFQDCVNPIYSCGQGIEASIHFYRHCSNYHCAEQTLFKNINKINSTILKQNDQVITKLLLLGNEKLKTAKNKFLLKSTIEFLQDTNRFKTSLFN